MFRGSTSDAPLRTTRHRRKSPLPSRDGPIPFPTGAAASLDVPVIVPEHYPAMGPFGAAVLDALEQRIPGIRDKVEMRDAAERMCGYALSRNAKIGSVHRTSAWA